MKARLLTGLAIVPLLLAVTACNRHNAPSDQLAQSAKELVGAATPTPPPLASGRYAPRDTCGKLPGAEAFLEKLAEAVMARDTKAFAALAAEDVMLDVADTETDSGGNAGRAELKRRLVSKDWMLWDELDQLLKLGCSANEQGGITIPWFYDQHISSVNAATGMLVTGENVPLLTAPDPKSKPLETISWDVVSLGTPTPDDPYQQVTATDGKQGYIANGKLRSLIDYRLKATQRNGKWSIISLVSGD